ncbi:serine/threonine-protein kinase [Ketobacter sp.]|uniref:serine/threonine-protein kinase n=1 Tax=Ketobacter sp. TaxID=2083498 RepID=UPI0025C05396|nr:serine/threonine-protein kinase [Ketobacter sp.]
MSLLNNRLQSLLSLKGLLLISGILLLSGVIRPDSALLLERWYYQLGQRLSAPANLPADIALIELDAESVLQLQRDPGQSDLLPLLLQPGPLVGMVLDHPLREQNVAAERLLNWLEKSATAPEAVQAWQEQNRRFQHLQQRLQRGDILLGLTAAGVSAFPEQAYPLVLQDSLPWEAVGWIPEAMLGRLRSWLDGRNQLQAATWPVDPRLQGPAYRAVDRALADGPRQLIWEQESQLHPGLALALYTRQLARTLEIQDEPTVRFNKAYAIEMAHIAQPISRSGTAWIPASVHPLKHYSQAQALARPPAESVWIMATDVSLGESIASTLLALQNQQTLVRPSWGHWLSAGLVLVGLLYLMWIQPLFRPAMAIMTAAVILLTLSVIQVAWQLSYQQILPLPLVMAWFTVGSVLMLVWRFRQRQWTQLQWENHNISYQLGQQWYQQGRLEEALAALRPCQSTEAVLTLLYDIGVQQERKRQYQEAARTYGVLVARKPKFKDARKRADALQQLSEPVQVTTDFAATHSLVMPSQDLNKPVLGRYEIERELGRGAMGVVYLGLDPKIARRVAIKTLSYREFDTAQLNVIKERFFREAEAAGRLNHPNIVTVYDVGEETDLAFIAMDYVEGKSLDRWVAESALLPIREVYEIVAEVAEALAYAHQQNIVHRDIKPGNIMYDQNSGQVKVADFGIARIVDDSKTKTGDMLGSPVYMSPEQLKGAKVTGASDVYSLGVTLYQLLTGALPFNGDSIANLAYQILNKKYISVRELRPELSAGVVRVVNKALQKEPSKRYESAADMASALRGLLTREFGRSDSRKAS